MKKRHKNNTKKENLTEFFRYIIHLRFGREQHQLG